LGGELAGLLNSFAATKVLVHRDLNPRYVTEANLRDFVKSAYDLIVIPANRKAMRSQNYQTPSSPNPGSSGMQMNCRAVTGPSTSEDPRDAAAMHSGLRFRNT